MKKVCDVLWWLIFIVCATVAQAAVPGVDIMTVGLIILLQERDYRNLAWLLPIFILMQEGMGTRTFGAAIVWYAVVIILFKIGRWLFEVENFVFVFMLSFCLGAAYFGVTWFLNPLQDVACNTEEAINASLMQAIFLPFTWWILMLTRRWKKHEQEN